MYTFFLNEPHNIIKKISLAFANDRPSLKNKLILVTFWPSNIVSGHVVVRKSFSKVGRNSETRLTICSFSPTGDCFFAIHFQITREHGSVISGSYFRMQWSVVAFEFIIITRHCFNTEEVICDSSRILFGCYPALSAKRDISIDCLNVTNISEGNWKRQHGNFDALTFQRTDRSSDAMQWRRTRYFG